MTLFYKLSLLSNSPFLTFYFGHWIRSTKKFCFLRSSSTPIFLHLFLISDHQCDLLLDPVNGEVHQTGRYLGDRAIYTCGHGWEIVGAEERVCQASGEWSNQEPYCKKRGKTVKKLEGMTV